MTNNIVLQTHALANHLFSNIRSSQIIFICRLILILTEHYSFTVIRCKCYVLNFFVLRDIQLFSVFWRIQIFTHRNAFLVTIMFVKFWQMIILHSSFHCHHYIVIGILKFGALSTNNDTYFLPIDCRSKLYNFLIL